MCHNSCIFTCLIHFLYLVYSIWFDFFSNNSTNNDSDQETGKVTLDSNDNQAVSEQDMDDDNDMNTPNMVTVEYPDEGKAKITNEDDTVGIVENKDGVISSTSYIYKNQKIDSVIMTMEFKSNDEAKK